MQTPETKRKLPPASSPTAATATATDDDGFTKVERRKQRKVERRRPQFQFDTNYFQRSKKVGVAHIRDLALFISADQQRPGWIVVDNPSAISHTVVLMVSGLLPAHLGIRTPPPAACLPFQTTPPKDARDPKDPLPPVRVPLISKLFSYGCPTRAPGDARRLHSTLEVLLRSPLPEKLKAKREAEAKKTAEAVKKGSEGEDVKFSPLLFLCTPNQMIWGGYTLPSYVEAGPNIFIPGELPKDVEKLLAESRKNENVEEEVAVPPTQVPTVDGNNAIVRGNVRATEGWIETPEATGPPPDGKYPVLAIDCEMVLSEDGQELARVSIVDVETGKAVFDEAVTPPKPVLNYLTQYSGMTEELMKASKHTLKTIQEALVTGPNPLITPHTILLGHSLDCDLQQLKIRHPLVIDTSSIYKHPRGPPYKPSLKWLVQKWLQREIQAGHGQTGHDSVEDARACVDLLKMKLVYGPQFGDPSADTEPIFDRLARYAPSGGAPRTTLIADYRNPRATFGAKATTVEACNSDEEVAAAVVAGVASHDVVYARMKELAAVQGWDTRRGQAAEPATDAELNAALKRFNSRLQSIHDALPANTALILLTGQSNPLPMLALQKRRQEFDEAYREASKAGNVDGIPAEKRWTTEDDRALEAAVAEAREGMSFFCIK